MNPNISIEYNDDCSVTAGNITVTDGASANVPFRLKTEAEVVITIQANQYVKVRACVDNMTWERACDKADSFLHYIDRLMPGEHELNLTCETLRLSDGSVVEPECRITYDILTLGQGL